MNVKFKSVSYIDKKNYKCEMNLTCVCMYVELRAVIIEIIVREFICDILTYYITI